jgi:uncharacterized membrane protein
MVRFDNKRNNIKILIILSLIFGSLFFTLRVLQYKSFFSFEWEDHARHNQLLYNIATSFTPQQTIFQSQQPRFLNDHFHPIYFLIALLYKLFPGIYTWYFIICFSYGFSSLTVYYLARKLLNDEGHALFVSLIYLLYPPLHYATLGALDALSFSLPFLFIMFYFLLIRKYVFYLLVMVLVCLCREDIPVYIFALGIYQIFKKYQKRYWISTLLFSGIYFIIALYVMHHYIQSFEEELYDYITVSSLKYILIFLFNDTKNTLDVMFEWGKMRFFVMLLYPLIFLPVFSSIFYVGVTIVIFEIGIPDGFFNENSYYVALMIPFLFMAAISTLKKIRKAGGIKKFRFLRILILVVCIWGNTGRNIIGFTAKESGFFQEPFSKEYDRRFIGVKNIFDRKLYIIDEDDQYAWDMLKMIPNNASLMVTGDLLPAASSRRFVYEFGLDYPGAYEAILDDLEYPYNLSEYILINKKCLMNGLGGHFVCVPKAELLKTLSLLIKRYDYVIKEQRGSFILLERMRNQDTSKL